MSSVIRSSSASTASTLGENSPPETVPSSSNSSIGTDDDYPAQSFPGYAEKPLDEQLEPIAVVGMGCRLPGDVKSTSDFWDLIMKKGTGNMPKVPASRFNIDAHIHQNNDRPGSFGVPGGYFLKDDLADFDPGLFGITPVEAMWMDPQQRKLLEVVYEALESGGIPLEKIAGTRTAVFAASFTADWQQMAFKEHSFRHSLAATGVDPGIISNRISHVFDLNGPSIMCNTACSSSVYALHNACNALRNGEAEGAIVGGVNLIITVDQHMNTAKLGVLSPTSTCHTFDASADGYGRGEAVGAVYLKRLPDAIRDGDPIRGVIRSSATNSNGKVPAVGITHPNREGQAQVISAAYKRGGDLDPRLTGYFECHGTGTAVGDPLEVHAVSMAMNKERRPGVDRPLWIGAVKTNIGHSEAASGISALIKAILITERGMIPATRGVENPSKAIKWEEWQVQVPTNAARFPRDLPVRRVSINSFGYGGTNAHVIVEGTQSFERRGPAAYTYVDGWTQKPKPRFPASRRALERKRPYILPFSAHDKPTLRRNIDAHGVVASDYSLLDLSHTLANRRSMLASKAFTVASYGTLNAAFDAVGDNFTFADKKNIRSVGFVFTGQGAQWARMGAELIKYCPGFLQSIRALDSVLEELHDGPEWSIEDILLEHKDTSPVNDDAQFSQPLCTAVQIAIVQQLQSWGVRPAVTVGHSSGEMAAGYAAGLVSAEDAIIAAYYRGKVAEQINTGGAMLAVGLGADAVKPYLTGLEDQIVVACHNSPSLVTLSGDGDALDTVQRRLNADGVFNRAVKTNGKAYHSHHMLPAAEKYRALVYEAKQHRRARGTPLATSARMVSSVNNAVLPEGTFLDADYWSQNLRSPVLFNQAIQTIFTDEAFADVDLLVEIGPHSALAGPIKQIRESLKGQADKIEYVPTLIRGEDCGVRLLKVAGELFLRSYKDLDMKKVTSAYIDSKENPGQIKGSTIVDLPLYQWNYTRQFWAESRNSREQRQPQFPRHDVLGQKVIGSSLAEPTWRNVLRVRDLPWLKHHHLGGESVFPAAGYFSMAIEAIRQLNELSDSPVEIESYVLRDVSIKKALVTPDDDDGIEVLFNMRPSVYGPKDWDWRVSSVDSTGVNKDHMQGSININTRQRGKKPRPVPRFTQRASGKIWNEALRDVGFDYGLTFQDMDDVRFDGKQYHASCSTKIKQAVDEDLGESRYVLHPASIDSTLQLCIAAIYAGRTEAMACGVVPVQVDEIAIWPPTAEQLSQQKATAYANVHRRGLRTSESTVQMTSVQSDEMVMEIVNMRATSYEAAVPQRPESALKEAPYAQMTWEMDFDVPENRQGLSTSDLANLALFKYPTSNVAELGVNHSAEILRTNPEALYTVIVTSEAELEAATPIVDEYRNAKAIHVDPTQELEPQGLKRESYDVLIASTQQQSLLSSMVKPGASAVSPELIVAGKTSEAKPASTASLQLVYRSSPPPILSTVRAALEALGSKAKVTNLMDSTSDVEGHVIMLADFEGPLIFTLQEDEFAAIQNIVARTSSLLWVTPGGFLQGKHPEYALISGVARAITAEQASLDFRTLDIDPTSVDAEAVAQSVLRIVQLQTKTEELPEREFCVSGGKTYISRLARNNDLNRLYRKQDKPNPQRFTPGDRVSGLISKTKVVFQQQEQDEESGVRPGHVEVQVLGSGLTREGILVITGSDYATTFSQEIGGIVTRVGSGVSGFASGDRVVGFHTGHFESYQEVPAMMLHRIKAHEDMNETISGMTPYAAALYGLYTLAGVRKGENVLILNKTGFAGVAAIKLTQKKGANPYVVADTEEEAAFLQTNLGLTANSIIRASDGLVGERLAQLTGSHGADVVFSDDSSVDPTAAHEAWRYIAPFGRFLDSGRKGTSGTKALDGVPIHRSASYIPFDILELCQYRPEVLSELLPAIVSEVNRTGSDSVPIKPVQLGEIDAAVSNFSDAFGSGKPVLQYQTSDIPIQILPTQGRKLRLRPDVTYLLVGCLGGLGRSLTSWMMECGARRFTFLSRSGADAESAAELVRRLEAAGAVVQVVRGDATSRDDVARVVNGVPREHPIRGVIHAAMVLRDALFHSMTYKDWKQSIQPKVLGAQNLHAALAHTLLDFFVLTSSVSGILGTPGQSNYAAANTYLDSLARHRRANSQAATSAVLPMVLGVGVVAESETLADALKRKGMYGIDERHLIQSFEAAMISSTHLEHNPDHVVIGLDPAKLQKAAKDSASADSFWMHDARFSHAVHSINASSDEAEGGAQLSILNSIRTAGSPAEAVGLIGEHFVDKLARMLMLDPANVDPETGSIASYGIDSMIGAELRNWIFKEFAMDVPFQQLLGPSLTIARFASQVCATYNIVES